MIRDYKEPRHLSEGEKEAQDNIIILIIVAICFAFGYTLKWYLELPTLKHSISTDTCYEVVDHNGIRIPNGCERLPGKYHMEYVP